MHIYNHIYILHTPNMYPNNYRPSCTWNIPGGTLQVFRPWFGVIFPPYEAILACNVGFYTPLWALHMVGTPFFHIFSRYMHSYIGFTF